MASFTMKLDTFFEALWQDYIAVTPQAQAIRRLFEAREGDGGVINDHVAFRTFSDSPLDLDSLEPVILSLGYRLQDNYRFEEKNLHARSYLHDQEGQPKIFVSELHYGHLSRACREILKSYRDRIAPGSLQPSVFWSGRHWPMPEWEDYRRVAEESEYGAWLLVMGLRANHFTICVDCLKTVADLREALDVVKAAGFQINEAGGEIKGSPDLFLEQAATMADRVPHTFADGVRRDISRCFYEFAQRYRMPDEKRYEGFVTSNADRIFESTNVAE